jgi:hypothetical protein
MHHTFGLKGLFSHSFNAILLLTDKNYAVEAFQSSLDVNNSGDFTMTLTFTSVIKTLTETVKNVRNNRNTTT